MSCLLSWRENQPCVTFRHTSDNGFGWFGQGTELFDWAKSEFDFSKMQFVFENQGWLSKIGVCLENQVLFSKIGICFLKIGNYSKKAAFAFGFRSFLYFSRLYAVFWTGWSQEPITGVESTWERHTNFQIFFKSKIIGYFNKEEVFRFLKEQTPT